jgi:hypothetical protein
MCPHLSAQHTWPQLYACLSIISPFSISHHPQLAQLGSVESGVRKSSLHSTLLGCGFSI